MSWPISSSNPVIRLKVEITLNRDQMWSPLHEQCYRCARLNMAGGIMRHLNARAVQSLQKPQ
jgi:hypothetical protein